jgi:hypothetical protein
VRNTLLAQSGVENVAVDFNKKIAYLIPGEAEGFDSDAAIVSLTREGYGATLRTEL